jgi:hypothetical protein
MDERGGAGGGKAGTGLLMGVVMDGKGSGVVDWVGGGVGDSRSRSRPDARSHPGVVIALPYPLCIISIVSLLSPRLERA